MNDEKQRVEDIIQKLASMEAAAQAATADCCSEDALELRRMQRILELRRIRNLLDNWDELLAADHADRLGRIGEHSRHVDASAATAEYRAEQLNLLRRSVEATERQTSAIVRLAELLERANAVNGEGKVWT